MLFSQNGSSTAGLDQRVRRDYIIFSEENRTYDCPPYAEGGNITLLAFRFSKSIGSITVAAMDKTMDVHSAWRMCVGCWLLVERHYYDQSHLT